MSYTTNLGLTNRTRTLVFPNSFVGPEIGLGFANSIPRLPLHPAHVSLGERLCSYRNYIMLTLRPTNRLREILAEYGYTLNHSSSWHPVVEADYRIAG
jgi:hypothetical protein